ncbi:MAG TPA: histidine kinase [Candidatus Acidoferrales bacterium]|nr:histidine kinase [Candidatus Acidoferrales bacterium]
MTLRRLAYLGRAWPSFRGPAVRGEAEHVERVIATGRVFLAVSGLVAILFDSTEPTRYFTLVRVLLILYAVFSVLVLLVIRARLKATQRLRLATHAADVFWATALTLITEGPNSPFFVFLSFVLLAAAYRWGFRETVSTAGVTVLFLLGEATLLAPTLTHGTGPMGRFLEGQFELNRLIMRSAYLLLMGVLLGYLAQAEKQLRAETHWISQVISKAQASAGLRGTVKATFREVLQLYGADRALFVVQELTSERTFFWEVWHVKETQEIAVQTSELDSSHRPTDLFLSGADAWYAVRKNSSQFNVVALDMAGRRIRSGASFQPPALLVARGFRSALAASFAFGNQWAGSVFLFDSSGGFDPQAGLRFFQRLLREAGPAIYSVYLVHRLRSQIGAFERARVARELHDGAIQSLLAAEMQVEVLSRQARRNFPEQVQQLTRVQELIHREVLNLRDLMDKIKPIELSPKDLPDFLADWVEKFERETGITATFYSEAKEARLPPRVCHEIIRIVQEALFNVRKHSGAETVQVRLTSQNGQCRLEISDNGQGFGFSGRLVLAQLEADRRGPRVIQERVRVMGGEMAIESQPGQGARLEITLPQKAHG